MTTPAWLTPHRIPMNFEPSNAAYRMLGEAPSGTAGDNSDFDGPNLKIFKASDVGITLPSNYGDPGGGHVARFQLGPGQSVPGGARYMISQQGRDPLTPGYGLQLPDYASYPHGSLEDFYAGNAWHFSGTRKTYYGFFMLPSKAMAPDDGPGPYVDSRGRTVVNMAKYCEAFGHSIGVLDGAYPSPYFAGHGHNQIGLVSGWNIYNLPYPQFTPRPIGGRIPAVGQGTQASDWTQEGFLPPWVQGDSAKTNDDQFWALTTGSGDATNNDTTGCFAIRPFKAGEMVCLVAELLRDDTHGELKLWLPTLAELPTTDFSKPLIHWQGSVQQYIAGSGTFDPMNPWVWPGAPRGLEQTAWFALGTMIYNGSVSPPAVQRMWSSGIICEPDFAKVVAELQGGVAPPPPPPPIVIPPVVVPPVVVPPPPAPGPDPVAVGVAISHLLETCDWMHRTGKTGGLGYSIERVRKTHAYAALVALGGFWPTK